MTFKSYYNVHSLCTKDKDNNSQKKDVLRPRLFVCALFWYKNIQMYPNSWVFRNFIWVFAAWAEFLKNLMYWAIENVSEYLSFWEILPEFRVKFFVVCRKAEFLWDLSFGPNAQKSLIYHSYYVFHKNIIYRTSTQTCFGSRSHTQSGVMLQIFLR